MLFAHVIKDLILFDCAFLLYRSTTDAGSSSATGLAAETILEDEPEEDVAPTPEQLEVNMACSVTQ